VIRPRVNAGKQRQGVQVNAGEIAHFRDNDFVMLPELDRSANMGEFVVGMDAGEINAAGGPCPIVAMFSPAKSMGCLIHIDGGDAEQNGNEFRDLIDAVWQHLPRSHWCPQVIVCYDPCPLQGTGMISANEAREQRLERGAYIERVVAYLRRRKLNEHQIVTRGSGKYVVMDTSAGRLRVLDGNDVCMRRHNFM
jgi:hypothetical protein